MSIGSKMRSLGDSTYFLKTTYEPLKEIIGDKDCIFEKDPINGYIIHTDRIEGELLENVDELLNDEFGSKFKKTHYNHHIEVSWRDINKYAGCKTVDDLTAVNPDYKNDLTSEREWIYSLPNIENIVEGFQRIPALTWDTDMPSVINIRAAFKYAQFTHFRGNMPKIKEANQAFCQSSGGVLVSFEGRLDSLQNGNSMFWTAPYMSIFKAELPSLSSGDQMFSRTKLDNGSALRILNSIPSYTSGNHPLMIGIHVDHQTDEEVLAAIANAESKGWTLTVQWNGTPTTQTTSTFCLRKPSIYAKLSEIERPDGSKEQILDWGHYVSNPENYEEFSSLEEAYEHFGLPNDLEKLNNSEQ